MVKSRFLAFLKYFQHLFFPIVELFLSLGKKYLQILLFLLLPIIFLIGSNVIHQTYGNFYQGSVDPEYFHLYNGIVIGGGNLAVQYTAHPGTPLQLMIAVSARITYLIDNGDNFRKAFIDNPEKYLHSANLFMNLMVVLTLFVCGFLIKKYTGSYLFGILFQLSPFGSASLLILSGRLIPESTMIIPLLLIGLMIVKYIYQKRETTNTDLVVYGIIIAFGIALKLSFIPIAIIPLVLLPVSIRQKFNYLLYTLLFFALFAYPVVFNFEDFWKWISGMASHSGMHGAGEEGLINTAAISGNLVTLFNHDKLFFIAAGFSFLLAAVCQIIQKKSDFLKVTKVIHSIYAINLTLLICLALTLKHFALHYFMPFFTFKILLVLLSFMLISKVFNLERIRTFALVILSAFTLSFCYEQSGSFKSEISDIQRITEKRENQSNHILSLVNENSPIIMSSPYYGSPFIEFGQNQGFMMCNHRKNYFKPYLKQKYPLSFVYVYWNDRFNYWDEYVDFKYILDKTEHSLYIYVGPEKAGDMEHIGSRIWQVIDQNTVTLNVLYEDLQTGERLVEIVLHGNE